MFYVATYQPSETQDLSSEARALIGKTIALQEGGRFENGPNKGQQCYIPMVDLGYCIPASHLKDCRNIPYVQWKEFCQKNQ